jgi:hypothetical protein
MLFDLRGRRRRAVQVTYLALAMLMGGGLLLFGIGGGVSGGLLDAFRGGGGGGNSGSELIQNRVEKQEARLRANPQNEALMKSLVRDNYALASSQTQTGSQGFPDEAKDELRTAAKYWQMYLNTHDGKPDPDLAQTALQVYDVGALNQPKDAQKAVAIIADTRNDSAGYLQLVSYAALAGDTRTANLAAIKAVDLAPKAQKKAVKAQAEKLKTPQPAPQANGG